MYVWFMGSVTTWNLLSPSTAFLNSKPSAAEKFRQSFMERLVFWVFFPFSRSMSQEFQVSTSDLHIKPGILYRTSCPCLQAFVHVLNWHLHRAQECSCVSRRHRRRHAGTRNKTHLQRGGMYFSFRMDVSALIVAAPLHNGLRCCADKFS